MDRIWDRFLDQLRNLLRLGSDEDEHLIPTWATGAIFVLEFDAASTSVPDDQQDSTKVAPDPG